MIHQKRVNADAGDEEETVYENNGGGLLSGMATATGELIRGTGTAIVHAGKQGVAAVGDAGVAFSTAVSDGS